MAVLMKHHSSNGLWWLTTSKVLLGLTLSLIVSFCFPSSTAEAHRPSFPDGFDKSPNSAFQLGDIDISQVIYQVLKEDEQVWLGFDPKSSTTETANIQLGVPVLEATESFRPTVALVGQNLGKIGLPFGIPDGLGAIVYEPNDGKPIKKFHEPFTSTDSWILIGKEFQLGETRTFYFVIFSKTNQSGKFWFTTGSKEMFDFSSLSELNKNIASVKIFHEPSIYASDKINLQNEELEWQNRLKKNGVL